MMQGNKGMMRYDDDGARYDIDERDST